MTATVPVWIDTAAGLAEVVRELSSVAAYSLDTEFHRERSYWPHLALVQLAWPGGLALIDPIAVDVRPLADVLDGPGLAVVHAADQDIEVLDRACGTIPARLFDTQVAAGFLGLSSPSLSTLAERIIGLHLPKGDRLTDWTRRPLSDGQRSYAAADVEHLLTLRDEITGQLEATGRLGWAEEECELLRARPRAAQDPETAWWRLKDNRHLRGAGRGVAQELAAWRERRAAELDQPPRFVLPDMAVLAIANALPRKAADLEQLRGVDGRHARGQSATAILDAVARGLELPAGSVRLPDVDALERSLRPAVTLVSAWVAQLARDVKIDAALLATRSDLHDLLGGDPEARLAKGWRAEVVGERVRRLVKGEAALAFDGRGGLVLEARSGEVLQPGLAVPDAPWTGE